MGEYLVRWKFLAHTPLNDSDEDTWWRHQVHPNKDEAVAHYVSLLKADMRGQVVEIFELVELEKT